MSNHLEHLARRLEDDPFFLACPLRLYANSERLNETGLAAALKCSRETLTAVLLCRAPSGEGGLFFKGIERIATRFYLDADALAEAVRRGQALFQMSRTPNQHTLLAARDGDVKKAGRKRKGDRP